MAAGASDGWPLGYIVCLCKATENSTRNAFNSRDSVVRGAVVAGEDTDTVDVEVQDSYLCRGEDALPSTPDEGCDAVRRGV